MQVVTTQKSARHDDVAALVRRARQLRVRREVTTLDYNRLVHRLAAVMPQTELARELHVSQPAISKAVSRPVAEPREGFSGATPYEVCQRYAAGELTREQVVDELVRWPYEPTPMTDGWDDLLIIEPGTWQDVADAHHDDLIDDAIYSEVLRRTADDVPTA